MPLPKSSTMMLRNEPALIATIGYQMTASSPRGTFSQAELTAELVTRRIWVRRVRRWRLVVRVWAAIGICHPLTATNMTRCSSQRVPGFPVAALPVSPHIDYAPW
jgi:hypothetical protein